MTRATAIRLTSALCDWSAAFLLFTAVFTTFDGRTELSLTFLAAGLLATLLARVIGGLSA